MIRQALLWCSRNRWMNERLPRYRFVQRAVSRFMPGEELEDALIEAERLAEHNIDSVLTLLGENVTARDEATRVANHYRGALDRVDERGLDAQLSIKLTQLGLDLDPGIALENLSSIVDRAAVLGNFVWIDMEDCSYTDVTLDLFEKIRAQRANVGLCLQAYLYRTPEDLDRLQPLRPAIRLVKGAYAESADHAFPKKRDVDKRYFELACRLLGAIDSGDGAFAAFATHDGALIDKIRHEAERSGVSREGYEFEMLYGIGRERQRGLARGGARLRILISYGSAWFPWYVRRLAERPANLWFVVRSFFAR